MESSGRRKSRRPHPGPALEPRASPARRRQRGAEPAAAEPRPYESLLTPLAALGSQTSGTSQGTTVQSVPLSQQIIGGAIGGLGLLNGLGLPLPKVFGPNSSGSQGG